DAPGDQVLREPFDSVWEAASDGRPAHSAVVTVGLQARLEQRVQQQKTRLARWHTFSDSLASLAAKNSHASEPESSLPSKLRFEGHHDIKIGGSWSEATTGGAAKSPFLADTPVRSQAYSNLLTDMRTRLSSITSSRNGAAPAHDGRLASSGAEVASPRSRLSASFDHLSTPPGRRLGSDRGLNSGTGRDREGFEVDIKARNPRAERGSRFAVAQDVSQESEAPPPPFHAPPSRSAAPPAALSLAERTRLSMAHAKPHHQDTDPTVTDDLEDAGDHLPSVLPTDAQFDRRASLLDRTRQSMSLRPPGDAPSQRPRKSAAVKAAKRTSLFPVNPFETPRTKKRDSSLQLAEDALGSNDSTPREVLFSDGVEYASVFRSRPKLAMSPVYSPQDAERTPGLDGAAAAAAADDDDDANVSFASSPLGRIA
ncbi:MAG: hypothetical protein INR71_03505, partial [Terriglobus roseus]|nr:hypothetical protein [Terriglobus roseus]